MELRERVLYHQVHPLKLATDISTALAALALLWSHQLVLALAVMWIPSIAVTAWLVRFGSFEHVRDARIGARLRRSMTRSIEGLRFTGLGVAAVAAWQHAPAGIALGAAIIIACWCWVIYR